MIPVRPRRLLAALLAGAGFAALLADAATQEIPLGDSFAMAGRFWNAGPRGRLLNAPGLARDADFAAEALRASAAWPVETDVVLRIGPRIPADVRERLRRKAAYLLAPRRVLLVPGSGSEVRLLREKPGDPTP